MATVQVMLSGEQAGELGDRAASSELAAELRQESRKETRRTLASFLASGTVAGGDGDAAATAALRFRRAVFVFFDDPTQSRLALGFSIYFITLIVFSTLTFVLQTMQPLSDTAQQLHVWSVIEVVVIAQFTTDYLIRIVTCPTVWRFVVAPLNLVDLIAIVPFWVELGLVLSNSHTNASGLAVIRVIRLLRVFRLLKLGKNSKNLKLVAAAMWRSREGVVLLLFMVTLAMVLFSAAMFYAETAYCDFDQDTLLWVYNNQTLASGNVAPFQSIVATFWWAIVTMTTVGYGDNVPVSGPGKVVGAFTIVMGILVLAFPITIISGNLNEVYGEFRREEAERMRVAELRKATIQIAQKAGGESAEKITELLGEYADPKRLAEAVGDVNKKMVTTMIDIQEKVLQLNHLRGQVEMLRDKLTLYSELQALLPAIIAAPKSPRKQTQPTSPRGGNGEGSGFFRDDVLPKSPRAGSQKGSGFFRDNELPKSPRAGSRSGSGVFGDDAQPRADREDF